jgi:Holliday junction resolvase RusA-like endonuclease
MLIPMKYHVIIEISGLPKTVNELGRKHWAVKVKHNRKWQEEIFYALQKKERPEKPLEKVVLQFTRYSSMEPDFDNLVNSFKPIMDALVKAKIIKDDKPSIVGNPTYGWQKCKKGEGKIEIEIKEV